jgi:hypothetical protein
LLLLDEPTNDLDDQAVEWLETQLRAHHGTVLVVTHDRVFLERLTTTVLEAEGGKVTRYGDGCTGYRTAKAAEHRCRLQEYQVWRSDLARNERLAADHAARLGTIPRKAPLATFGHGGFRARGRAHGAMARIRNVRERVERLTARWHRRRTRWPSRRAGGTDRASSIAGVLPGEATLKTLKVRLPAVSAAGSAGSRRPRGHRGCSDGDVFRRCPKAHHRRLQSPDQRLLPRLRRRPVCR